MHTYVDLTHWCSQRKPTHSVIEASNVSEKHTVVEYPSIYIIDSYKQYCLFDITSAAMMDGSRLLCKPNTCESKIKMIFGAGKFHDEIQL